MEQAHIHINRVSNGFTVSSRSRCQSDRRTFIANDASEVLGIICCLLLPEDEQSYEEHHEQGQLFPDGDEAP